MEYIQRRTKVTFGRTMMQSLELLLLRLAKSMFRNEAKLNSEEIKPVAIAIIEIIMLA